MYWYGIMHQCLHSLRFQMLCEAVALLARHHKEMINMVFRLEGATKLRPCCFERAYLTAQQMPVGVRHALPPPVRIRAELPARN
jgi:hypothetical protein